MATPKKSTRRKIGERHPSRIDPMEQLRSDMEAMIAAFEERLGALEEAVQGLKDSLEDEERNDA